MKILVFGASGMIGSTLCNVVSNVYGHEVTAVVRRPTDKRAFAGGVQIYYRLVVDFFSDTVLKDVLASDAYDIVVNCAGITKHLEDSKNIENVIAVNALLPHRMARICSQLGARFIQISTDCVFSGSRGNYSEADTPDAEDFYGRSKYLGECTSNGALTIRTSTIGHEIKTKYGLLEWFLQQRECSGYRNAVFSGLTTLELANVFGRLIIGDNSLSGLYHVGGLSINKLELLEIINSTYKQNISIREDRRTVVDRSIDSSRFYRKTGYVPRDWTTLVREMYAFNRGLTP